MKIIKKLTIAAIMTGFMLSQIVLTTTSAASQEVVIEINPDAVVGPAKQASPVLTSAQLKELHDGKTADGKEVVFIDVRTPMEVKHGIIKGAVVISPGILPLVANPDMKLGPHSMFHPSFKNPENKVFVPYCLIGARGAIAAEQLKRMGYSVGSAGIMQWVKSGGKLEAAPKAAKNPSPAIKLLIKITTDTTNQGLKN